jgi:hypothetical protein
MPAWAGATASAWKIPLSAGTIAPASPPAVGSVSDDHIHVGVGQLLGHEAAHHLRPQRRGETGLIELSPSTTGSSRS